MSEQHRTKEEYTELYADQYCEGDIEVAAGHKIVKEVCEELREEWVRGISILHRTKEEYTELYADQYCEGDIEVAAGHKIVKEVCEELREEWVRGISILEYLKKKGIIANEK